MKKRILDYRKRIDDLLEHPQENRNWNAILNEHLAQIAFFQHERLIHLIVTALFSILTILSAGITLIAAHILMLLLTLLFLILLIPYIMHYYLLENEVQKMYLQYDEISKYLNQQRKGDIHEN